MASLCSFCSNGSIPARKKDCLKCGNCEAWRCKSCSVGLRAFFCAACDASDSDIRSFLQKELQKIKDSFAGQINEIKEEIRSLKQETVTKAASSGPSDQLLVSKVVQEEIHKKEMARCLVISGVEEFDDEEGQEGVRLSYGKFNAAVHQCLSVCDESFNPDHLQTCNRMGTFDPERKRLVKVILSSSHVQRQILQGAKKAFSQFRYRVRPSKSLEERRRDLALIKKMFDHNNNPENKNNLFRVDWNRGKIVPATDPKFVWTTKTFKDPFAAKLNLNSRNQNFPASSDDVNNQSFASTTVG